MKKLDPKAVWIFFFNFIAMWTFAIIFLTAMGGFFVISLSGSDPSLGFLETLSSFWLFYLVLAVFLLFWAHLSYKAYSYELTDDGFRKEYGVIYKTNVTIPYNRIQNVDIYRGILARLLGLADLNIQTAGSSYTMVRGEGRLPGVSRADAEVIRDELIARAKNTPQGL